MKSLHNPTRRTFLQTGALSALANAMPAARAATPNTRALPRIKVHADGHMLQTEDGAPFFWLADTAWQLMHALKVSECRYYLAERARQGFTVVQIVALCETHGVREPNALGLTPFSPPDSLVPNPAYFNHLLEVIDTAASYGIYVALLPTWADKLTAPRGDGPRLFRFGDLSLVRRYASYLADLVANRTNVVWMLGGDRPAQLLPSLPTGVLESGLRAGFAAGTDWRPIWKIFADEIGRGKEHAPLLLYHPQGGEASTSVVLGDTSWLSVNGMQSGHGSGHDVPVWEWVRRDVAAMPAKPTLDLEPNYEDHPVNPWPQWNPANGYFRDADVRRQVYRAVFAGACGTTYGHHAVWQFAGKRDPIINHADMDWTSAMQRPAGRQMVFLRHLMLSRPYFDRVEAPEMLFVNQMPERSRQTIATRARDGSFAFVFFPQPGQSMLIDFTAVHGASKRAWWFSPQTGIAQLIELSGSHSNRVFTSPDEGSDSVLVIDAADADFPPPGLLA